MHGVIHTSIVCVYEFRRGFCTSVLSFVISGDYTTRSTGVRPRLEFAHTQHLLVQLKMADVWQLLSAVYSVTHHRLDYPLYSLQS